MIINKTICTQNSIQSTSKQPNFGRKINEQKLLERLSNNTYKAMDIYITNLLNVVTDLNKNEIQDIVSIGIQKAKTMDKNSFYSCYSKILKDIMQKRSLIRPNNRENWYADITSALFCDNNITKKKNNVYLDVGCGNCNITRAIADKINISIDNTYGIDLLESKKMNGILRQNFDGKNIPLNIPSADFVTLFQVLHHIKTQKDAEKLLKSIYKNMNNGGHLLIREHETRGLQDKKFWKFIHDFQCRIIGTASKELDNGTLYINSSKWENLLNKIGFKTISKYEDISYNDKSSYFLLLQK